MDAKHEDSQDIPKLEALEAILFASPRPLPVKLLAGRLGLPDTEALALLRECAAALRSPGRRLQLRETNGSWRL